MDEYYREILVLNKISELKNRSDMDKRAAVYDLLHESLELSKKLDKIEFLEGYSQGGVEIADNGLVFNIHMAERILSESDIEKSGKDNLLKPFYPFLCRANDYLTRCERMGWKRNIEGSVRE